MGRHAAPKTSPKTDPETGPVARPALDAAPDPPSLLGWGLFTTVVAAAMATWASGHWSTALPVGGLGLGATLLLWAAAHVTQGPRRGPDNHRSRAARSRSVKCPRDQWKR